MLIVRASKDVLVHEALARERAMEREKICVR